MGLLELDINFRLGRFLRFYSFLFSRFMKYFRIFFVFSLLVGRFLESVMRFGGYFLRSSSSIKKLFETILLHYIEPIPVVSFWSVVKKFYVLDVDRLHI